MSTRTRGEAVSPRRGGAYAIASSVPGVSADQIVGRTAEVQAIDAFAAATARGPGTLLLRGEAGAGKTVLWQLGVDRARTRGHMVLVARAAEHEARFGFAALGDLLEGRLEDAVRDLPDPQRRALRVALALEDAGDGVQESTIAVGLLGALRSLAGRGPVLVAVDDAQWLDQPSAAVLGFAARRLRDEPVRFLVTQRAGADVTWWHSLPEPRTQVLVGPLGRAPLQRLLHAQLGKSIPSRTLRRLWEVSAGNPLYALELGRLITSQDGGHDHRDVLPIPTDLERLLRARLSMLTAGVRSALLAAALLAEPTVDLVEAAAVGGPDLLVPAFAAQLIELDGERLRFTHPLFASAVAAGAEPCGRQAMHRRLAGLVTDPEQRAWHLGLGVLPPDEPTAALLARAAGHAFARGAGHTAAELAEEAWRFTEPGPARWARLLTVTDYQLRLGGLAETTARIERELPDIPPGPVRAELLLWLTRSLPEAGRKDALLTEALALAGDNLGLRAQILSEWMYFVASEVDRIDEAHAAMRAAVALAAQTGDAGLELRCRANLAWAEAALGHDVEDAMTEMRAAPCEALWDHGDRVRGIQLLWRGELDKAEALLTPLRDRAAELEEEWSQLVFALHLFELESRRGDAVAAAARLAELQLVTSGISEAGPILLRCEAQLAAMRGDLSQTRVAASAVLADPGASRWHRLEATRALGVVAFTAGQHEQAVAHLQEVDSAIRSGGFRDPGAFPVAGDLAEALHLLDRPAAAEQALKSLEAAAAAQAHPWGLATAARVRGLLSQDEEPLREAIRRYDELSLHLEFGRTQLALGRLLRRNRRRGEARQVLAAAAELFAGLGLPVWAERAQAEAARIGGRAGSGTALTPGERQLAELVASGRTNKEAAAELFISLNTVESALRRVYVKLGVRSRTELVRQLTLRS